MNGNSQHTISFDEFELDSAHRRLLRRGEPLSLYAKTFDLLAFLVNHNGDVVTKDEILDAVWPGQIVEESNLSVQIAALRKALGEKKNSPRFLITVPGKGYKFVADVQNGSEIVIEKHRFSHLVVEEEVSDSPDGSGIRKVAANNHKPAYSVLFFAGSLALSLLIAGGLIYQYRYSGQKGSAAIPFAGAPVKQLTSKGKVNNAVISPDGKFFAYALLERGEYRNSLWLGQTDGGTDIQLRPPDDESFIRGLAFSPDGKTLYFVSTKQGAPLGALFKMPIIGGVAEKLLDNVGFLFALSPDGKQIAFFRRNRGMDTSSALIVSDLDGGGERELAMRSRDKNFSSFSPAWSPDGSMLAFAAVSDRGKRGDEIFTVRTGDGHIEQLTELEWVAITSLIWRGDGRGLIAAASGKGEPKLRHLWHIDYPGGTASKISQDTDSYALSLSLSADDNSLLAVQLHRESNIWIAPSDDLSHARQVTFSAINGLYGWHGFDWTTDGNIVFSAAVSNSIVFKSMSAGGGDIKQITSAGFLDQKPDVAADGRYIVFQSNRGGGNDIWRIHADGTDLRQLTTGGSSSAPRVTPDGKWVVYISTSEDGSFLSRIPVDGGDNIQISGRVTSADCSVSPDGKLVAYGTKADESAATQLAIVSAEDGRQFKMFDAPSTANFSQSLRWTPDGNAVCYRDWANGVWCQDMKGGPPKNLEGLPEEKLYSFDWSPDGKLFTFSRGREIRDVVLIGNSR